jgi:hypothetical protein
MSYLLEALKKAELERNAQAEGSASVLPVANPSANLPGWLIFIVISFLIITLVKLFLPSTSTVEVEAEPISVFKADVIPVSPVVAVVDTVKPLEVILAPPKSESESENENEIIIKVYELAELPKEILNMIPTLSLQSHIFSSAPEYRSVVINEQTFNEGMLINAQVVLQEITHTGIVINVAGRNVALAKGVSWVSSKHVK